MTCKGQCVRGQCLVFGVPQLFQVQEDVKAAEQRVAKLQESLQRNKQWVTKEGNYSVPLLTPPPPPGKLLLGRRLRRSCWVRKGKWTDCAPGSSSSAADCTTGGRRQSSQCSERPLPHVLCIHLCKYIYTLGIVRMSVTPRGAYPCVH